MNTITCGDGKTVRVMMDYQEWENLTGHLPELPSPENQDQAKVFFCVRPDLVPIKTHDGKYGYRLLLVAMGNTHPARETLKKQGYSWSAINREWTKTLSGEKPVNAHGATVYRFNPPMSGLVA